MKSVLGSVAGALLIAAAAVGFAPPASAMYLGNYNLHIPDRRDFHTWILSMMNPCAGAKNATDCIQVIALPQPIAKAYQYEGEVRLIDGQYVMTVDDPFGLRCGNIYYGPTVPTHDVYRWDPNTLAGTLESSFAAGCDGAPGGTLTYPLWLTRM